MDTLYRHRAYRESMRLAELAKRYVIIERDKVWMKNALRELQEQGISKTVLKEAGVWI